jgi:flagellar FliL protein
MSKTPQDRKREAAQNGASRTESKLVTVIVVTAFITTVISAAVALMLQRLFTADPTPSAQIEAPKSAPAPAQPKAGQKFVYYDFPKMTVVLKKNGNRPVAMANIRVSAEFIDAEPLPATKGAQPRIVDAMQSFLRECSREELDGRAGTDMLRQAFLGIVNDAILPHRANAILFKEIVIQ